MRLIPVLDLQHGVVVRGIGGRRSEYRPLVSPFSTDSNPANVARNLIESFQSRELYVADIDAIAGRDPSWPIVTAVGDLGAQLWIDAGIRTADDLKHFATDGRTSVVIGLETVCGPDVLDAAFALLGAKRVIFSLDLRGGLLLGQWRNWSARDERGWQSVVDCAVESGVRSVILLDLSRVGEGRGLGTEAMCRTIVATYPGVEVICGGGVRDVTDLRRLQDCGASAALVASALHDGRIRPEDWPPAAWPVPRSTPDPELRGLP